MKIGIGMDMAFSRRKGFGAPMSDDTPTPRDFGLYLLGDTSGRGLDQMTIPSVAVAGGSTLLVVVHGETTIGAFDGLAWGATSLSVLNGCAMSQSQFDLYALYNATGGTFDLVASNSNGASVFSAMAAFEVPGVASSPLDRSRSAASTSPGTTPSSGAMASTVNANDLIFAALATEGPFTDAAGTWGNSFVSLDRVGTSDGSPAASNSTIQVASKIVAATAAYTANLTGITSRNWGMVICGLKQAA